MHIRDNATKRVAFVAQTLGCEWVEKGKKTLSTEIKSGKEVLPALPTISVKGKKIRFP
ncbi:MAG TPA: hypothetical protein PLO67_14340 [Saprospiraceae bacterium]|nr:hypothetical protein [Saprospiraceae bacterium]HPI06642.1 hypothetical protein [Saprospiraceae bacterium]